MILTRKRKCVDNEVEDGEAVEEDEEDEEDEDEQKVNDNNDEVTGDSTANGGAESSEDINNDNGDVAANSGVNGGAESSDAQDNHEFDIDEFLQVDLRLDVNELLPAVATVSAVINSEFVYDSEEKAVLMVARYGDVLDEVKSISEDSSLLSKEANGIKVQAKDDFKKAKDKKKEAADKRKEAKDKLDFLYAAIKEHFTTKEKFDDCRLHIQIALMRHHKDFHKFDALISEDRDIRANAKTEYFNNDVKEIKKCIKRVTV